MVTHADLQRLTHGELCQLELTYDDLQKLSGPELQQIALDKLAHFQPDVQNAPKYVFQVRSFIEALLLQLAKDASAKIIKSADWKAISFKLIQLIDELSKQFG